VRDSLRMNVQGPEALARTEEVGADGFHPHGLTLLCATSLSLPLLSSPRLVRHPGLCSQCVGAVQALGPFLRTIFLGALGLPTTFMPSSRPLTAQSTTPGAAPACEGSGSAREPADVMQAGGPPDGGGGGGRVGDADEIAEGISGGAALPAGGPRPTAPTTDTTSGWATTTPDCDALVAAFDRAVAQCGVYRRLFCEKIVAVMGDVVAGPFQNLVVRSALDDGGRKREGTCRTPTQRPPLA